MERERVKHLFHNSTAELRTNLRNNNSSSFGNMLATARRLVGLLGVQGLLLTAVADTGLPSGPGSLSQQPGASASRMQPPDKPLMPTTAASAGGDTATADVVLPADESVLTQGCTFFLVRRESVGELSLLQQSCSRVRHVWLAHVGSRRQRWATTSERSVPMT